MRFGLFGGARTKRSVGLGDSHGYKDFIDYVQEAERLGFAHMFMVEHHFTGQGQVSASMTLLSYLAAKTERIRLGTAVVVLPLLSGGRNNQPSSREANAGGKWQQKRLKEA